MAQRFVLVRDLLAGQSLDQTSARPEPAVDVAAEQTVNIFVDSS
jgi:hypothetical protein